jgi:hypothetical protein
MTIDEPNDQAAPENDFAAFEAAAQEPAPVVEGKKPAETKPDDTLELGGDDAPEVKEGDQPIDSEKKRGRPWSQRVDILTARLRDAERRAAELEAKAGPAKEEDGPKAPDAYAKNADGSDKYEFGEADPQYIKDAALFEVRQELAKEAKEKAERSKAETAQQEVVGKLQQGMTTIEKAGPEAYEDFEKVITDAVEARGGEPLPPLLSIGIAVSPAGHHISYALAKDEAAAAKMEKLATTSPQAAAVAFGELEGQFLDDDADLDLSDNMDMARMLGRMKARLAGKGKQAGVERRVTNAPEPPEHRSRGSDGQFQAKADTTNFAEFERLANKSAGGRR